MIKFFEGHSQISQEKQRIPSMDGLRFLMCLGIAALHFSLYFLPHSDAGLGNDGLGDYIGRLDYFNDVFFLLSGFFLTHSSLHRPLAVQHYSHYIFLRFARLYPLYFATLLFYILVALAAYFGYLQPDNADRYDLGALWSHLLLIQSWGGAESLIFNYPAWALSALWSMYIIFPLVFLIAQKSRGLIFGLAALFLWLGDYVGQTYCGESTALMKIQQCDWGIWRCIPVFLLGMTLAYISRAPWPRLAVMAALIITTYILFFSPFFWDNALRFIFIYLFVLCLLKADYSCLNTFLSSGVWRGVSNYAYGIYLTHPIIATVFISFLLPRLVDVEGLYASDAGWVFRLLFFVLSLIMSIISGMMAYYIIEKPVYNFAKKLIGDKGFLSNPIWKMKK